MHYHSHRTIILLIHRHIDELAPVLIVLRTFKSDDKSLKRFLSRLTITVETFATGLLMNAPSAQSTGETSPHPVQAKDLLHSQTVPDIEKPLVLRHSTSSEADSDYMYLVWKLSVFVGECNISLTSISFRRQPFLPQPE